MIHMPFTDEPFTWAEVAVFAFVLGLLIGVFWLLSFIGSQVVADGRDIPQVIVEHDGQAVVVNRDREERPAEGRE